MEADQQSALATFFETMLTIQHLNAVNHVLYTTSDDENTIIETSSIPKRLNVPIMQVPLSVCFRSTEEHFDLDDINRVKDTNVDEEIHFVEEMVNQVPYKLTKQQAVARDSRTRSQYSGQVPMRYMTFQPNFDKLDQELGILAMKSWKTTSSNVPNGEKVD